MGNFSQKQLKLEKKNILLSENRSVNNKNTHEYILVNSTCADVWPSEYLRNSSLVMHTLQGYYQPKHYERGGKCI